MLGPFGFNSGTKVVTSAYAGLGHNLKNRSALRWMLPGEGRNGGGGVETTGPFEIATSIWIGFDPWRHQNHVEGTYSFQ